MKLTLFILSLALTSYSFGYFSGNAAPTVTRFSRERVLEEVRDDTFRKCLVNTSKINTNGVIEEEWKCGRAKFFITKKHFRTENELGEKGAE